MERRTPEERRESGAPDRGGSPDNAPTTVRTTHINASRGVGGEKEGVVAAKSVKWRGGRMAVRRSAELGNLEPAERTAGEATVSQAGDQWVHGRNGKRWLSQAKSMTGGTHKGKCIRWPRPRTREAQEAG